MTMPRSSLSRVTIRLVCLATLALGCDADRRGLPPGGRPVMLTRVSEEAAPAEEPYANPKELTKHFAGELARLLKEEKVVSPAELADQEEKAGTCEVETLPDPGRKLSPEDIYARARRSVVIVGAIVKRGKGHEVARRSAPRASSSTATA